MDIRLDGKTSLITGGSEGLGLAMAHKFSQSGANVALLARDASKLESAKQDIISSVKGSQVRVETFCCDVTDANQIQEVWKANSLLLGQVDSLKSMGPLGDVLGIIPGMNKLSSKLEDASLNEHHLSQIQAIIFSMTVDERRNPNLINGSRKKRIAKGSGTSPQQVNQLLNQFNQTRKLMKQMNSGRGFKAMQRLLR